MTGLKRSRNGWPAHSNLLLTDIHMPDMDGYQLARAIQPKRSDAAPGECRSWP